MRPVYLFVSCLFLFHSLLLTAQTSNWESLYSPLGGHVYCIAQDSTTWYIGTDSGIFFSTDYGDTWERNDWAPRTEAVVSLEIRPDEILFNTGTFDLNASSLDQIRNTLYRSADGGTTWDIRNVDISPSTIEYNFEIFRQKNLLFAKNEDQFYRSASNGASWIPIDAGVSFFNIKEKHHNDSLLLIETNNSGARYSRDGGGTWLLLPASPAPFVYNYVLGAGDTILSFGNISFRTFNFGVTWETINAPDNRVSQCRVLADGRLAALVNNTSGNSIIYISNDGGINWVEYNSNLWAPSLGIVSNGDQFGVATPRGVYKNNSGGNILNPSNTHLNASTVKKMVVHGGQILAAAAGGLWRTFDSGTNWLTTLPQFELLNIVDLYVKGDTLCALTTVNFFYSTNQGEFWIKPYNTVGNGGPFDDEPITFAVDGDRLLVVDDYALYFSNDFGASWDQLENVPTSGSIKSFIVAEGYYFVITGADDIFRSDDHGVTWQVLEENNFNSARLYYLHNRVFVVTNEGTWISSDFGDTWQEVGMFGNHLPITVLAATASDLYAGVDFSGVYRSTDGGISWKLFSADLPNPRFTDLLIDGNDIYAACLGDGIWRYQLPVTGTHTPVMALPLSIWPNPVGQTDINIRWPGPDSEPVDIQVYNNLGQCVLQNREMSSSGRLQLQINKFPPGIYQAVCTASTKTYTGTFIKIK